MKIGDKLLFVGNKVETLYNNFTNGHQYEIYKIESVTFQDERCCWVKDDFGDHVYFKESEAIDDDFICIKLDRKEKLKKIFNEN